MKPVYKLKGVVQHYSWGGTSFLPQLLSIPNPEGKPFGEYWLGAHPSAPALVEEENTTLDQLIANHPSEILGTAQKKFSSLPFLFKILDVRQMLSIQVHPSKEAAKEEFEIENRKGTPLTAPHRNYKDANHKPELMVALSDFWLLHGFKPEAEINAILSRVPELRFLKDIFRNGNYKALYEQVMTMPQEKVDELLAPLIQRIVPAYQQDQLSKDSEDFWAARAALTFCKNNQFDRGIFSIYLFNLVNVKKGEAVYQPAGLPHAYLEGQNVEVMANSDNVLRAGLTDKHVDVAELLKHVSFEPTYPQLIHPPQTEEQSFEAPVEEFHLKRYVLPHEVTLSPRAGSILFVSEGHAVIRTGENEVGLKRGEAALLLPGSNLAAGPAGGTVSFFIVSTPLDKN